MKRDGKGRDTDFFVQNNRNGDINYIAKSTSIKVYYKIIIIPKITE